MALVHPSVQSTQSVQSVQSIPRTSEIEFFSSLHGREKRLERGITKRDLQSKSHTSLKSRNQTQHMPFGGGRFLLHTLVIGGSQKGEVAGLYLSGASFVGEPRFCSVMSVGKKNAERTKKVRYAERRRCLTRREIQFLFLQQYIRCRCRKVLRMN